MRAAILIAALLAVALSANAALAETPDQGDRFALERVGNDFLTIQTLVRQLAAERAKVAELQAQLDKRKADDEAGKAAAPPRADGAP